MTGGTQAIPSTFLERARREAERYGDDPWILLRELVQNSRDAGAARISFYAARNDSADELTCVDDGCGMDREEMRRYLLRLYASRKGARGRGGEPAGRFGVGFWSVLRFDPALVRVESCSGGGERTAFVVDCAKQELREVECRLKHRGTRVTLLRRPRGAPFTDEARERLVHWAGHVQGEHHRPPPQLLFNGDTVNRTFSLPPLIGERLAGNGFDGAIGLAGRPDVRLYAHGLLIREAASLEELLPRRARRRTRRKQETPGLHPVVHVNADGLEVLLNRKEVVEDKLLEDIVRTCEQRLDRLRRRLVSRLSPLRFFDRLRLRGPRYGLLGASLLALAGLGYGSADLALGERSGAVVEVATAAAPPLRPVPGAFDAGVGAQINERSGEGGTRWDLTVSGDGTHFLKVATQARFSPSLGLVGDAPRARGAYPPVEPGDDDLELSMGLGGTSAVVALPLPAFHDVVASSVVVDGRPQPLFRGRYGEPLLVVTPSDGRVRYRATPAVLAELPPEPARDRHAWPRELAAWAREQRALPVAERVRAARELVEERVAYSTSRADAAAFFAEEGSFPERVLAAGKGDCDVMNGLFALLLRELDVPARLAVGLVVEAGEVAPDLHAWTELYAGGAWQLVDVSPPLPREAALDIVEPPAPPPSPALVNRVEQLAAAAGPYERPLAGVAFASLGALLGLLSFARPFRARREDDDEEQALARLLYHFLDGPRGGDPLYLRYRPFFPTTRGNRRLSLSDLERLGAKGRLFAARPADPLSRYLRPEVPIVDESAAGVRELLRLVPEVVRLADLAPVLREVPDPALEEVEARLRALDDDVRLHLAPGARGVRELELPVSPRGLPPRHLLVGADDPRWRELRAQWEERPALARFRLLRWLLEDTTLYREQRDGLLAQLGREAL